jgi:hypothetical protein
MWQWDQIKRNAVMIYLELPPDHLIEFLDGDELRNSQSAHRYHEARPQVFDLVVHPTRAVANLDRAWDTITAAWRLSGKTADDGGKVNAVSYRVFVEAAKLVEPAKQRLSSGMREWSL